MRRISWISSCVFMFLSSTAVLGANLGSDECTAIDHNAAPDSCFRNIPIYDQAETGICYSYAATQLVDCYRFSHGEPRTELTNPVYAAAISRFKKESLYGGDVVDVISSLQAKGSCPQSEVDRDLAFLKSDLAVGDAQVLAFIEEMFKNYQKNSRAGFQEAVRRTEQKIHSAGDCEIEAMANLMQLQGLYGLGARTVLQEAFKSCESKKKQVRVPPVDFIDAGSDRWIQAKVDVALKRNPVAVGVCSQFLEHDGYEGLNGVNPPFSRRSDRNVKSDCKPHAVVVTGRRQSGGKCQYLIRNSWGTSWRSPTAQTCACYDVNNRYWEDCRNVEMVKEYVGCWFDADAMVKNTTEVTTFQ